MIKSANWGIQLISRKDIFLQQRNYMNRSYKITQWPLKILIKQHNRHKFTLVHLSNNLEYTCRSMSKTMKWERKIILLAWKAVFPAMNSESFDNSLWINIKLIIYFRISVILMPHRSRTTTITSPESLLGLAPFTIYSIPLSILTETLTILHPQRSFHLSIYSNREEGNFQW